MTLWSLPVALTACLAVGVHRVEALRSIDHARDLLVAGDHAAVSSLLESRLDSPWVGARARAGSQIARAFVDDRATAPAPSIDLDAEPYPLPVVIRAAFERGEFGAVLRLTELAEALGQPTVPLVTVAARIEDGQPIPPTDRVVAAPSTSRLASRVADHLSAPAAAGVTLRDRSGRPIGHLADGVFHRVDEVPEHWIPRAVETLGSSHPDAGSLRLALDLGLTRAAARAFGRFRGSIVLVDPRTGEILTAISDRRTHARTDGTPAFEQVREPASIAKLITTAAYLRAGQDPDHRLRRMRCRGHVFYDDQPVYCPYIAGPLRGLDRAMAVSCNVAFAEL
ncbi:MAG: penicillin-binding transpeptidase domain-containing protein, partial [Acidobacteriota bacterium]